MASKDDRKSPSSLGSSGSNESPTPSESSLERDDACGGQEVTIAGQSDVSTSPDVKHAQLIGLNHGPRHSSEPQPVV